MSTTTDNPDRIEAEVEEARARLTRTIEEIRDRMSPGQILDQALDYARDSGGGEFTRNLGRQVRDNPLPILLIGAGIGWLMASDRRGRAPVAVYADDHLGHESSGPGLGERARSAYGSATGAASSAYGSATGAASSAYGSASGAASSAVQTASDAASSAYRGTADAVGGVASSIHDAATGTASAIGHAAQAIGSTVSSIAGSASSIAGGAASYGASAGESLHGYGSSVRRTWSDLLEQQPLVAGAIGLAVGAAIGAALPPSRIEDEWMGSTADRLKDQTGAAARSAWQEARATGREFGSEVMDTVDREGLSGAGIGAAIDRAAEKVGGRVAEATGTGATASRSEPGRSDAGRSDGSAGSGPASRAASGDRTDMAQTASPGTAQKPSVDQDSPLRTEAPTRTPDQTRPH